MKTSLTARLSYKPYNLFLLASFLLFAFAFFVREPSVDIHLHDTYYVIETNHFIWSMAIICFAGWTLYKMTNKFLRTKYLTWPHVVLTVVALLLFVIAGVWHDKIPMTQQSEAISLQVAVDELQRERNITRLIEILFIIGQLAYIANLIGGLSKRRL